MVTLHVVVQPLASVTVKVNWALPADELAVKLVGFVDALLTLQLAPGGCAMLQLKLYGVVPPEIEPVRVPVPPQRPLKLLTVIPPHTKAVGWVIEMLVDAEQPLASVTVNEKGPPADLVKEPVPVYGGVPPEALTVTVDVPPKHRIGVAMELAVNTGGWLTVIDWVAGQLFESLTVTLCEPWPSPVKVLGEVAATKPPPSM